MKTVSEFLGAVEPLGEALDALSTSGEERGKIRLAHTEAKIALAERFLEQQTAISAAQARVQVADASGHSWLQRSWRPLAFVSFTFTILWTIILGPLAQWLLYWVSPDVPPLPIVEAPGWLGTVLTAGLTVVGAGRSMEKITDKLVSTNSISFGKGSGDEMTRAERRERRRVMKMIEKETDPVKAAELMKLLDEGER